MPAKLIKLELVQSKSHHVDERGPENVLAPGKAYWQSLGASRLVYAMSEPCAVMSCNVKNVGSAFLRVRVGTAEDLAAIKEEKAGALDELKTLVPWTQLISQDHLKKMETHPDPDAQRKITKMKSFNAKKHFSRYIHTPDSRWSCVVFDVAPFTDRRQHELSRSVGLSMIRLFGEVGPVQQAKEQAPANSVKRKADAPNVEQKSPKKMAS